jgi:hypothetical protein
MVGLLADLVATSNPVRAYRSNEISPSDYYRLGGDCNLFTTCVRRFRPPAVPYLRVTTRTNPGIAEAST